MDKTLTARASWLPWLFFFARTEAPARLLLAPLMLLPLLGYVLGGMDRKALKQATQRIMMGPSVPRTTVERAATAFAERFGSRHELPAALAAVAADRAAGCMLVMATASPHTYAAALADRWGFDRLVATRNVWAEGRLTPAIEGENCYEMGKMRMLLADLDSRPAHVRFVSDHVSDLPVLLWADEPVAANPSAALRRQAVARGWPIRVWAGNGSAAAPSGSPDRYKAPVGTS